MSNTVLKIESRWTKPRFEECEFYHSFDLPGGECIKGTWDLRGKFEEYIGGVDVRNRSVFDFGTASGFLAFAAERCGASGVVAHEAAEIGDTERVPFRGSPYWINKNVWSMQHNPGLDRIKNGFWYIHHSINSTVEACYAPIKALLSVEDKFDVVLAGAIIEHLSDPVTAIGACCRLARDTVVIAFTPIYDSDDEFMKPAIFWDNPETDYVWYALSKGLYKRIFDNMGFSIEIVPCTAQLHGQPVVRSTLVARRRDG